MKFIKLTDRDSKPVWVNMSLIIGMTSSRVGGCNTHLDIVSEENFHYNVKETPEQIMELIG